MTKVQSKIHETILHVIVRVHDYGRHIGHERSCVKIEEEAYYRSDFLKQQGMKADATDAQVLEALQRRGADIRTNLILNQQYFGQMQIVIEANIDQRYIDGKQVWTKLWEDITKTADLVDEEALIKQWTGKNPVKIQGKNQDSAPILVIE